MDGYEAPSEAQVQTALRRIPTPQLRRVFFEALENPLWVEPLRKASAFSAPPEPVVDEKGLIRELYWPEIDYLIRVAPLAPAAVVDVLLDLQSSRNSWVRRGVFEIGAKISAKQAARLKPLVDAWKGQFGWRTDAHDLAGMARNLLTGGQRAFGRSLANMLFRPGARLEDRAHPTTALDEYWYGQELPGVVDALGDAALAVVIPWLEQWEIADRRYSDKGDFTHVGRADVAHGDDTYENIEQSLVDAIRDIAITSFGTSPTATAATFLRRPMIILRKIALYAADKAVNAIPAATEPDELLDAGVALLRDTASGNYGCRVEFADLYRTLRERGAAVDGVLRALLEVGPHGSRDGLVKVLARRRNQDKSLEEQIRDETDHWQQTLLAAIGIEHLPEDLTETLRGLDQRHGAIESPRQPDFTFTSWSETPVAITLDELKEKSPSELGTYLQEWRAGDAWTGPTHEGMARLLTELITSDPGALGGVADLAGRLRPAYLRAILQGWIVVVRTDGALESSEVLDLAEKVLSHDDQSEIPAEGHEFDDDPDYASAKQSALTLLTELAKPRPDRRLPDNMMQAVARLLLSAVEDESAWERFSARERSDDMDPLTVSLNWSWPIGIRGLINLASHGMETPWFREAMQSLERELGRDDQTGVAFAVVGEGFGRLYNNAPDWLNDHVAELFGTESGLSKLQQIALTTALATQRMHPRLLELLRGSLMAALELGEPLRMGWSGHFKALQLIGHWIITCLIWGELEPSDNLVERFFNVEPSEVRGDAIGHIAWSFMHAEQVDPAIRARLEELWDRRVQHVRERPEDVAELKDFYWFVRSGKFAEEWWLPRLKEAAELSETLSTHGMIGKQLATASVAMPREALDALMLLMGRDDDSGTGSYDLSEHAAPAVIGSAMDSGDALLEKDAWKFLNELGARGFVNMENRVNKVRGLDG